MTQNKGKAIELQPGELGLTLVASMPEITLDRIGDDGINNERARDNLEIDPRRNASGGTRGDVERREENEDEHKAEPEFW